MKETKKSKKIFGKGRWESKAISRAGGDLDQIPADEQYSVAVEDELDAPVDGQVAQIHNVLPKERNGLDEMAITERDVRNELAREKRLKMQDGDADAMLNYFDKMSEGNQNFFHTFRLDAAGQLQDILWVDARSRAAYEEFGDVVVFDTTYLTNQYELPFANFVGVNHHGQTILLGCALISHETTDTFTWLFREWLHCMSGKAPLGILTDQAAAMKTALSLTMPGTTHRFCIWHITSKFSDILGKRKDFDEVKEDLLDAIYDSLTPEEFVQKWCGVIEKHGLTENEWLDGLYREKEMWIPAYTKHLFWAGMKTTQRVESIHSFFDDYVDKHTRLCEFADSYCEAMEARADAEKQFDAHSASSVRQLMTGFPAEAVFQRCYTNMKFREVQRECTRIVYLHCFGQKRVSEHETEYVIEDRVWCVNKKTKKEFVTKYKTNYRVRYDSRTMLVDCECKMFECSGIMCRHMIKLYDILGVFEVPERYILRRWRKDVQRKHTRVKVAYHDPSKTEQVRGYDKLQLAFEPICSKASVHKGTIDLVLELLELMDIRVDEKTTMIENELLNQIPSSVCNQEEKQATPVSTTAAVKRNGNRSDDIGLAEEDDVPNETGMDLSQPQRVIIHCKTGVNEVCEKFDELEVIEDSNEIAKKFNMNTNNPNIMINFDAYEDIPVEVSGENVPKPVNTFAEIDLGKALNENIRRCKYVKPTPIQRHAIPIAMMGRDLMACAQTGSGKTAAFCFPIIAGILKRHPPYRPPFSLGKGGVGGSGRMICPVALIMSPTRELSSQTHDEAKKFSYQTGVKVAVAYGGTPMGDQLRLAKGVDILVATPGRLVDMIERGKVSLRMVRYLALDEADRMLDMGFEPQIRKIVQQMDMPLPGSRQTMLFSATFPTEIQRLASDFLRDYIFLTVGKVGSSTDLIEQKVEFVNDFDKRQLLKDLLTSQRMNGTRGAKPALTIVFVETKRGVDDLEQWLSRNGFPATAIHGDKVQWERERALESFKSGATPIIVATDVAARGLDIPSVAHVINFDLPRDIDNYVHRIGRTGRAGKSGLATAFFNDKNLPISKALVELMEDSHQEVPSWLAEYADTPTSFGYGGGSGSCRSQGGKFGGLDYRNFNRASVGHSDYSNTYADEVPSAEPFVKYAGGVCGAESFGGATSAAATNSYTAPAYDFTTGYESIVPSGWD